MTEDEKAFIDGFEAETKEWENFWDEGQVEVDGISTNVIVPVAVKVPPAAQSEKAEIDRVMREAGIDILVQRGNLRGNKVLEVYVDVKDAAKTTDVLEAL